MAWGWWGWTPTPLPTVVSSSSTSNWLTEVKQASSSSAFVLFLQVYIMASERERERERAAATVMTHMPSQHNLLHYASDVLGSWCYQCLLVHNGLGLSKQYFSTWRVIRPPSNCARCAHYALTGIALSQSHVHIIYVIHIVVYIYTCTYLLLACRSSCADALAQFWPRMLKVKASTRVASLELLALACSSNRSLWCAADAVLWDGLNLGRNRTWVEGSWLRELACEGVQSRGEGEEAAAVTEVAEPTSKTDALKRSSKSASSSASKDSLS